MQIWFDWFYLPNLAFLTDTDLICWILSAQSCFSDRYKFDLVNFICPILLPWQIQIWFAEFYLSNLASLTDTDLIWWILSAQSCFPDRYRCDLVDFICPILLPWQIQIWFAEFYLPNLASLTDTDLICWILSAQSCLPDRYRFDLLNFICPVLLPWQI